MLCRSLIIFGALITLSVLGLADELASTGGCCPAGQVLQCSCQPNRPACPNPVVNYNCPAGAGQIYSTGGKDYKIYCNVLGSPQGPNIRSDPGSSLTACADSCAKNPSCKVPVFDKISNICYQKSEYHGVSANIASSTYDTALPVPNANTDYNCPGGEGSVYSSGGIEYKIYCNVLGGQTIANIRIVNAPSLTACADQCSANPACQITVFDRPSNTCYHKGTWQGPSSNVPYTNYDTALPLKAR